MTDLVVWSDPDQYGQIIGTAGRIQMFIIGPDADLGGFVLLTRDLSDPAADTFTAGTQPYADRRAAELAAEDELVRILAQMDAATSDLRAP